MDSIVSLLKDTPIPTILVVGGIVFLFLALAGQIAGKLEVPASRQKWSALAGILLMSAGLLLYIIPGRLQGRQAGAAAAPGFVTATQPALLVQQLAVQSSGASPTFSGNTANPALAGGCFEAI